MREQTIVLMFFRVFTGPADVVLAMLVSRKSQAGLSDKYYAPAVEPDNWSSVFISFHLPEPLHIL